MFEQEITFQTIKGHDDDCLYKVQGAMPTLLCKWMLKTVQPEENIADRSTNPKKTPTRMQMLNKEVCVQWRRQVVQNVVIRACGLLISFPAFRFDPSILLGPVG